MLRIYLTYECREQNLMEMQARSVRTAGHFLILHTRAQTKPLHIQGLNQKMFGSHGYDSSQSQFMGKEIIEAKEIIRVEMTL